MLRLCLSLGLTRVDPAAYDGWNGRCPGCDRDAARFAATCHDAVFDGVEVFVNRLADHPYVRPAFEAAAKALKRDDLLVLFYSGHGGQELDRSGDEEDGRDETLCWWSGEVTDDVIADYLQTLRRGVRVLFVSDCCNAGSNYRGTQTHRATDPQTETPDVHEFAGQWFRPRSPRVLSERAVRGFRGALLHIGGCEDGRESFGDDHGGALTVGLLDVLGQARKPLSYEEWFDRAAARIKTQKPVLSTWGDDRELLAGFLGRRALT